MRKGEVIENRQPKKSSNTPLTNYAYVLSCTYAYYMVSCVLVF